MAIMNCVCFLGQLLSQLPFLFHGMLARCCLREGVYYGQRLRIPEEGLDLKPDVILHEPGERKYSGRCINENLAVCLCGVTNWLAVKHELSANEERRLAGQVWISLQTNWNVA